MPANKTEPAADMTSALSPKATILAYIDAIEALDFSTARSFFADEGFEYIGPNMRFTDPDALLTFQFGMGPIQKSIDTRRVVTEGDEVCVLLDYKTYFEPIGDVRVAIWAKVLNGKIQKLEVFYNAAVVESMLAVDGSNPFLANMVAGKT